MNMRYRIEIWVYRVLKDEYESDSIEDVLEWYKSHWQCCYECGGCSFSVYKNDEEMDFDTLWDLRFYGED